MRYAIVSDIHANRQAWSAVLEDIRDQRVDSIICLGDIVGYGPCPQEVLDSIRQATQEIVIGNHDAAACGLLDASIFNDHAREVVDWTATQLNSSSHTFLKQLPLTLEKTQAILFVHAEVEIPDRFRYIKTEQEAEQQMSHTQADIVFSGHTHNPLAYSIHNQTTELLPDEDFQQLPDHRYWVNVGSVGEPRALTDFRARYVVYDSTNQAVYFRRVNFDVEAYRADLQAVGLQIQPYFLSKIDHQAAQDVFYSVDDDRTVPENSDPLLSELPPPPVIEETTPEPRPTPSRQKPPSQPDSGGTIRFILFLALVLLAAIVIATWIVFS